MLFYMNNASFDNDDNPYGKFVLHMYTNMDGPEDIDGETSGFKDFEVPIKSCNTKDQDWTLDSIKYYCSDFNENHFLRGGFIADKYSRMRLAVHICDNSTSA